MKRRPEVRLVRSAAHTRYVRIQRLREVGSRHIVSVQLAEPDGPSIYSCDGIEEPSGAVELWTTGHGNLLGRYDEQVAEMRSILAVAA